LLARLLRFGLVGGTATATHAGVALAALHWLHVAPVVANATGFCVAFVVSFAGHALFTFRARPTWTRALRFTIVALSSVLLSSGFVLAAGRWTALPATIYLPLAAVCTPLFTFVCHSLWTFRRGPGKVA